MTERRDDGRFGKWPWREELASEGPKGQKKKERKMADLGGAAKGRFGGCHGRRFGHLRKKEGEGAEIVKMRMKRRKRNRGN